MRHPHAVRTVGRTAVVVAWLVALAVAGRPVVLAVALGLVLVAVWASPYLLATNRHPAPPPAGAPAVSPPSQ
jgi:hypothetical protein